MRLFYILFSFFLMGFLLTNSFHAAAMQDVQRGERPPIRYEEVPEEAYESGVLLIKFSESQSRFLDDNPVTTGDDGIVRFGIAAVDELNARYGVKGARQHFLSGALGNAFSERHRAWGFHLWYRLELDEKADVIAAMNDFQLLGAVEKAEPSFRKELIGSHNIDDFYVVETGDIRSDEWIPDDPQFDNQWHYKNTGQQGGTAGADISLAQAWEIEKGDTAVIVAIIDGGIDYEHEDLAGNMWHHIGYNFVNDSPNIEMHNHGTHVAGTVAAVNNNNIGVAGVAGGSGNDDGVRLMSCQVFAASSNGGFHVAPVWAADSGAAISQNSWGYTFAGVYEDNVLDAIDYFNTHGGGDAMDGGITVFAAGNSDSFDDYYPGYYSGTYAVAATNNQDAKAWYSNYGDHIDVSAPGGETNTVTERGVLSSLNNNQYGYYQGTSMACPHVSGVAALVLSKVYDELSATDLAEILTMTADNHYGANPDFSGQLGSGRVNAREALILAELFALLPANPASFEAFGVADTEMNISWTKNDDEDDVLLAWSDDGDFGTPEEGQTYVSGDELPGGGTILYAGQDTTFLHDDLDAMTQYFYRIWSLDDETVYSYGVTTHGRTLCGVDDLPASEDFSGGSIPYCWEFSPNQGNWEVTGSHGNPAPGMQFSWNPTTNNYSHRLQSPPFEGDIPGGAIALEFDMMLDNYSLNTMEYLSIEVFNGNEWVEVMAFDNSNGDIAWDTHLVDITAHALGNVFMIGFRTHGENSYNINRWVVDNFYVYSYSCPPPHNLVADELTTESAEVSWEALGDEDQWDLIYGPEGFDPYNDGNLVEGLDDTFYLLDNLEIYAWYDVYVRADCGDDDISVWTGPVTFRTLATCPEPVDLTVSNVTASEAEVSWTPMGDESEWTVAWGDSGFDPDSEGELAEGISSIPYVIQELNPILDYDVYVKAYCSSDDESVWIGPASFSTPCDIFQLPFTEDFHGASPGCWEFPDGEGNWKFNSTYAPPSSQSGPPHAVFTWNPSATNYDYSLVSPQIDATGINEEILIDYIAFLNSFNSDNLEQMAVEYKTIAADEWTVLVNYSNANAGSGNEEFVEEEEVLAGMAGQIFQVRFRAHGENSFSINGWSVDDIHIYSGETAAPCLPPVNLVASEISDFSALINWDAGTTESAWDLVYDLQGFDPEHDGILIEDITEKPYTLNDLEQDTDYALYLRAVCDGVSSEWSEPLYFTTEQTVHTFNATAGDHGAVDPEGEITVFHGDDILFTFIPDEHFHIADATLDGTSIMDDVEMIDGPLGDGQYYIPYVADSHDIHAGFGPNEYEIMVEVDPGDGGMVTGDGTYHYGQEAILIAEPLEDYVFEHWTENDEVVSEELEYVFAVEGHRELTAHFQSTVSAENLSESISELNVFPNPASDELWVSLLNNSGGVVTIGLYNLHGQKVASQTISETGMCHVSISLEDLRSGVYMLRVRSSDDTILEKVVVE